MNGPGQRAPGRQEQPWGFCPPHSPCRSGSWGMARGWPPGARVCSAAEAPPGAVLGTQPSQGWLAWRVCERPCPRNYDTEPGQGGWTHASPKQVGPSAYLQACCLLGSPCCAWWPLWGPTPRIPPCCGQGGGALSSQSPREALLETLPGGIAFLAASLSLLFEPQREGPMLPLPPRRGSETVTRQRQVRPVGSGSPTGVAGG